MKLSSISRHLTNGFVKYNIKTNNVNTQLLYIVNLELLFFGQGVISIMNKNPYEQFPNIIANEITLRKIVASDLDGLFEIYSNENLFQYSPVMLKKNKDTVANMIGHFERDFHKGERDISWNQPK